MSSTSSGLSAATVMALTGIAYAEPADIPGILARYKPTAAFEPVWVADAEAEPVNYAFLARDPASGTYVLAIRGTYPHPFNPAYWQDGDQSNPFSPMTTWPYATNGAMVTEGLLQGFSNVIALSAGGVGFAAAIAAIPAGAPLVIAGHSLGGSIAPLVGHYLSRERSGVSVATFAGMTPGNAQFAALFGVAGVPATRYWNTLDTVAYGWNDVRGTVQFYQPAPQGGFIVQSLLELCAQLLASVPFTPVGDSVPLPGTIADPIYGYLYQNLYQHLPNTYLALFDAPPLPFTLAFGAVIVPTSVDREATRAIGARHYLEAAAPAR